MIDQTYYILFHNQLSRIIEHDSCWLSTLDFWVMSLMGYWGVQSYLAHPSPLLRTMSHQQAQSSHQLSLGCSSGKAHAPGMNYTDIVWLCPPGRLQSWWCARETKTAHILDDWGLAHCSWIFYLYTGHISPSLLLLISHQVSIIVHHHTAGTNVWLWTLVDRGYPTMLVYVVWKMPHGNRLFTDSETGDASPLLTMHWRHPYMADLGPLPASLLEPNPPVSLGSTGLLRCVLGQLVVLGLSHLQRWSSRG